MRIVEFLPSLAKEGLGAVEFDISQIQHNLTPTLSSAEARESYMQFILFVEKQKGFCFLSHRILSSALSRWFADMGVDW